MSTVSQQQAPPYEDGFVDVNGMHVHFVRAGTGKPLLLLHGLAGSTRNWRNSIGALAQVASVYAIDMVNTGKSQRVRGLDAGLETTADRVAATMDALGWTQADIAGHSHGGAVALMLAARHPERVRSLILIAPANPYSHVGDRLARAYNTPVGRALVRIGPYLPRRILLAALARMYGDPKRATYSTLENYTEGLRVPGTMQHILEIVHMWFADMEKLAAALPRVAGIPILLLWGDRDRAVDPASAVELQRILPQAELHVVQGAGHVVFEEMPEEANRVMVEWLRRDLQPSASIAAHCDSTSIA
jgi:pimeloyl-ACP methyl ester carboxylesterase